MKSNLLTGSHPTLKKATAVAIDPIAQVRSELGWLSLLTTLVGEGRARAIIASAMNPSANDTQSSI
jgi:hypothetical protein